MTSIGLRIRRCRAQAAIDAYCNLICPDTNDENLTDLLADLQHWCDGQVVDFEVCLDRARFHYETEKSGPS